MSLRENILDIVCIGKHKRNGPACQMTCGIQVNRILGLVGPGPEVVDRDDERQACWEDFVQVIRNAIKDAPCEELTALHEAVFSMGWKLLGTGDGKPQHKLPNSAVSEWSTR